MGQVQCWVGSLLEEGPNVWAKPTGRHSVIMLYALYSIVQLYVYILQGREGQYSIFKLQAEDRERER